MRGVLTHNKSVQYGFVNGGTGRVTQLDFTPTGSVVAQFRLDDTGQEVYVATKPTKCCNDTYERRPLPLLPSHCVTVHRVQGVTWEHALHIVLNSEFFSNGQAYVAISRVRRLSQLHFWAFDMEAFKASPVVDDIYAKLREHCQLTQRLVDACADRMPGALPVVAVVAVAGAKRAREAAAASRDGRPRL